VRRPLLETWPQIVGSGIATYFEFWFNGKLVAKDPLTFTPHNAAEVSFEWDGSSDQT
jgi:hypothetical protein